MILTQIDNLPCKLRREGHFCIWRYESRPGSEKATKVPYNPKTGRRASSTKQDDFAPLEVAAAVQENYSGIGVGIFDDLVAIDIDNCLGINRELSPHAQSVVRIMNCYTEISPSGNGLRILCLASGFLYDKARYYINNQSIGLEVYCGGATNKYVTLTGDVIVPGDLVDRSSALQEVLELYMRRDEKDCSEVVSESKPLSTLIMSDIELIEKIINSKQGAKFLKLWEGNLSDYNDNNSQGDLGLCNILAFWTRCDHSRMDVLFRQSKLYRKKWDEFRGSRTYGDITIQTAIGSCTSVYDPDSYSSADLSDFETEGLGLSNILENLRPEKNLYYQGGDLGNGRLFADVYKDIARFVPKRNKWFVFTGKIWEADQGNLKVMELCKRLADQLLLYAKSLPDANSFTDSTKKWLKRSVRETILKDAASVYPADITAFDASPLLFNCLNGTLDLQTIEFRPHNASDMLSMISGVSYNPEASSTEWEAFIREVMQGDQEKAQYIQKALGLTLTGDTSYECGFILYGATTRNGKGTTMETYMSLLGDYGKSVRPDTIAQKQNANGSGPSEDIARLAGVRFANVSEPDKKLVLNSALVKTMTGNDTITARFLNENSFEFKPQFKMFINTNYLPSVTDATLFSSDRVRVIPFERHFSEEERDTSLKERLSRPETLSGILNWCIEGFKLLKANGFRPPESVLTATEKYRYESDKMCRFMEEELDDGEGYEVTSTEAYTRYQQWCTENGFQSGSIKTFLSEIASYVTINRRRPRLGGEKRTMINGYRLKELVNHFDLLG